MSSRARRMAQNCASAEIKQGPTRQVTVRLNLILCPREGNVQERSTFMVIDGIPAELPKSIEEPLIKGAERQFITALNQRTYLETYSPEGEPGKEHPVFVNLGRLYTIKVSDVKIMDDKPEVGAPVKGNAED